MCRGLEGAELVLVDGERIAELLSGRDGLPGGVEVVECPGTVLPGLIDAHTQLVADSTIGGLERAGAMTDAELDATIVGSLRAHAKSGVTTVRDMGDVRCRTLAFRDVAGVPRVVASGPPVTTPGGHCHLLGGAVASMGEADLRAAVTERAEPGVDVVKVMGLCGFPSASYVLPRTRSRRAASGLGLATPASPTKGHEDG
jgi:imidazolonepropionase-like amidohydrolase